MSIYCSITKCKHPKPHLFENSTTHSHFRARNKKIHASTQHPPKKYAQKCAYKARWPCWTAAVFIGIALFSGDFVLATEVLSTFLAFARKCNRVRAQNLIVLLVALLPCSLHPTSSSWAKTAKSSLCFQHGTRTVLLKSTVNVFSSHN